MFPQLLSYTHGVTIQKRATMLHKLYYLFTLCVYCVSIVSAMCVYCVSVFCCCVQNKSVHSTPQRLQLCFCPSMDLRTALLLANILTTPTELQQNSAQTGKLTDTVLSLQGTIGNKLRTKTGLTCFSVLPVFSVFSVLQLSTGKKTRTLFKQNSFICYI